MKMLLTSFAFVALVATICFFQTNRVSNANYSVDVPPIIIKPPFKVLDTKSTPVIITIKTLPKTTTKSV